MLGGRSRIIPSWKRNAELLEYNALEDHDKKPDTVSAAPEEESTGNADLDKRLSTGVLQGDTGTDAAQVWISAFLVAAFGFLVYLGSFSIPLHGADLALFSDSTALHRLVTAPEAMEAMPTAPLSVLGLATGCVISGGRVDAIHGLAILLHLCCAVLVFLLARRLVPRGTPEVVSMIAGLVFAVHPAVAGTVNYLDAYPVLQSGFFGLLALLLLLRGAEKAEFSVGNLAGPVICFVAAFGSDTATLLLPLAGIGLLRLHPSSGEGGARFVRTAMPVLVLVMAVTWVVASAAGLLESGVIATGLGARLSAFVSICGKVLVALVWPVPQPILPAAGSTVAGIALLALLVAGVAVGFLFRPVIGQMAIVLLVTIFSTACYAGVEVVFSGRYLYLPLAALAVLLPWCMGILPIPAARRAVGALAAVLVLVLGGVTFQHTNGWRSPEILWAAEADRHPDTLAPLLALGRFQWAKAQTAPVEAEARATLYADAEATWRRILEREPGHSEAEQYLGMTLFEQGEFAEAAPLIQAASERQPEDERLALYLAFTREQVARADGDREDFVAALRAFRRAARLAPLPSDAQGAYGLLAASLGDLETGVPLLQRAAGDAPDSPLAAPLQHFTTLAQQVQELGNRAETALSQRPDSAEGLMIRAEKNLLEGRTLAAFYLLHVVMDLAPAQDGAWAMLGLTSARLSGSDNFLQAWGASRAGNLEAWRQLAVRCAAGGAWDVAETYLRHGLGTVSNAPAPEIVLAEIAVQLRQGPRAATYLEAAQQAYPDDPQPWLRSADLAIAAQDMARARLLLDEAEKRSATPEELKARRDQLGEQGATPSGIQRTVIR